nr:hypothetical protein [Staphylococcus argenteus]
MIYMIKLYGNKILKVNIIKYFEKRGFSMNDLINEKIINVLLNNSRITINELSKQVNLSAPAVRERVNKLEDQGIIKHRL